MSERRAHFAGGARPAAMAAGIALVLATADPGGASSNLQLEPRAFGIVGLARGQSAALNAVLTHRPARSHPGCRLVLSFVDARGQVFRDRDGNDVRKTVVLRDNVAEALHLRSEDVLAGRARRIRIRPVVAEPPDTNSCSDCRELVVTFELVGTDGATQALVLAAAAPRDPPPPDPPCLRLDP